MRFSLPSASIDNKDEEANKVKKNSLIFCEGGAIYYASETRPLYSELPYFVYVPNEDIDAKFHLSWFKSSYFIWHTLVLFGTHSPKTTSRPIPARAPDNKLRQDAHCHVDNIFAMENEFLAKMEDRKHKDNDDKRMQLITDHNKKCAAVGLRLDAVVSKMVGLTWADYERIMKSLSKLDIFDNDYADNADLRKRLQEDW